MLMEYDVIIVGGGMTGAALAIALAGEKCRIAVLEAVPPDADTQPSYDDRGLALSVSSQRVLAALGLWDTVHKNANPVAHVHVSDQYHFGFVRLHAETLKLPALGYVVLARELGRILLDRINAAENVDFISPAQLESVAVKHDHVALMVNTPEQRKQFHCRLLIGADGSFSRVRELLGITVAGKDYGQTAIVTNVTPGRPHANTAYERFTTEGPLALLPLADNRYAVVFTVRKEAARDYLAMSDENFLAALQARFGRRLGNFQRLGKRTPYPLQQMVASAAVSNRAVILGNAAHTLHPNGAQGFNLCLRDIAGLAEVLIPALRHGADPGLPVLLNQYRKLRGMDQRRVIRFSDGLAEMFYNDLPHKVLFRNSGMLLLDVCATLKRSFSRRALGLHGRQPALVRGVPL